MPLLNIIGPVRLRRLATLAAPLASPISQTSQAPYDGLSPVASVGSDSLEATQAVAATRSDSLEATKIIAANTGDPWDALRSIASSAVGSWEGLLKLNASKSAPWDSTAPKQTSIATLLLAPVVTPAARVDHILRIRARKTNPSDAGVLRVWLYQGATLRSGPHDITLGNNFSTEPWHISESDASTVTDYSNLRVSVQGLADPGENLSVEVSWLELHVDGQDTDWESNTKIVASETPRYEALGGIASSDIYPWEANAPASQVAQTGFFPYEALKSLAASQPTNYESLVPIFSSKATPWTSLLGVRSSQQEPLESGQGISRSASSQYDALQRIEALGNGIWEALAAISRNVSDPYETTQGIRSTSSDPLDSLQKLALNASFPLEALRLLSSPVVLPWDATGVVFIPISKTASLPLDALSGMSIPGVTHVDTQKNLTIARLGNYEGLVRASQSAEFALESVIGVTNLTELPMEVAARLVAQVIATWETKGRSTFVTETGLVLSGAYLPPNHVTVIQASPDHFVVYSEPSELMDGKTETGLDIGET